MLTYIADVNCLKIINKFTFNLILILINFDQSPLLYANIVFKVCFLFFNFFLRLTSVNTSGIDVGKKKGASINYLTSTSRISVMPNNHPFGVVGWKSNMVVTTQLTEHQSQVALVIERSYGAFGTILISYRTTFDNNTGGVVGARERPAQPGVDFTEVSLANLTLDEGVREGIVLIDIHHVSLVFFFLIDHALLGSF